MTFQKKLAVFQWISLYIQSLLFLSSLISLLVVVAVPRGGGGGVKFYTSQATYNIFSFIIKYPQNASFQEKRIGDANPLLIIKISR